MIRPQEGGYLLDGQKHNLLGSLKVAKVQGHAIWSARLPIKEPGDYAFYLIPQLYHELADKNDLIKTVSYL